MVEGREGGRKVGKKGEGLGGWLKEERRGRKVREREGRKVKG